MMLDRRSEASYREVYAEPSLDPTSVGLPLLPEIRMVGQARFAAAQRLGLPKHRHRDAFEICYVVDGSLYWYIRDRSYALRRGDVFVAPPNEPHGGEDAVMQPCEIYWVQVVFPSADHNLSGMTAQQTKAIYDGLYTASGSPAFPSATPDYLESAFAALLREHRASARNSILGTVAARAALQTLLVQTVRDATESARVQPALSASLSRAIQWMEIHLYEAFTMETAAAVAKLSIAAFHDRFQREVGTTPAEWRTQKRIEQAKVYLIREPERSVTEIALRLGFASSQYFATAFKRYTAHTPTEYRQVHQEASPFPFTRK
jgi:AraC-like DNA-binding protein